MTGRQFKKQKTKLNTKQIYTANADKSNDIKHILTISHIKIRNNKFKSCSKEKFVNISASKDVSNSKKLVKISLYYLKMLCR